MNKRQNLILKGIIEEYLQTAKPISSQELLQKYDLNCSSATIRNDMSALENLQYLQKHHHASGRIPTTKGYRYYFDNLMEDEDLSEIKQKIEVLFSQRLLSIEEVIKEACKIISELTSVATIISEKTPQTSLKKIELIPLDSQRALAFLITDKGTISDKIFVLPPNTNIENLTKCIKYLNERLLSQPLNDLHDYIDIVGKVVKKNINAYEKLLQSIIYQLINQNNSQRDVVGINQALNNPEFEDPQKIKFFLQLLEENSIWDLIEQKNHMQQNLIEQTQVNPNNPKITFGEEVNKTYNDLAIISTTYDVGKNHNKQLSIIGPKRMDYTKISSLLKWIASKVESYKK